MLRVVYFLKAYNMEYFRFYLMMNQINWTARNIFKTKWELEYFSKDIKWHNL